MNRWTGAATVCAAFGLGALVNTLYAEYAFNLKCYNGSCTLISQLCAGGGTSCTWCQSDDKVGACGLKLDASCLANGTVTCDGTKYSGNCQWNEPLKRGICTGTDYVGGCTPLPKCEGGVSPPDPNPA
jgi:hypothetical protein